MKRVGYIYCNRSHTEDEKIFEKVCNKYKIQVTFLNLLDKKIIENLEEETKELKVIFNNSGEDFAYEIVKTLETLGKKVIDSSKSYYYNEDKWLFYLKCKEHKIPAPETILLSENINQAEEELKDFNRWPVILKRIQGTRGEYVEKAASIIEAVKIMKKFWKKGSEKMPVIAQEFIPSYSYRITTINNRIMQAVIKKSNGWKCTGVYEKICRSFEVDLNLKKIISKINKNFPIKVCGIDLLKRGDKWLVLEINTVPALDFILCRREELIEEIVKMLKKVI